MEDVNKDELRVFRVGFEMDATALSIACSAKEACDSISESDIRELMDLSLVYKFASPVTSTIESLIKEHMSWGAYGVPVNQKEFTDIIERERAVWEKAQYLRDNHLTFDFYDEAKSRKKP